MRNKKIIVRFRRHRDGLTDYRKRLALLKSEKDRLVIRKSLNYLTVQLVSYVPDGDKVLLTVTSKELEKYGWNFKKNNTPASYLVGFLAGTLAKKAKVADVVVDLGRAKVTKGSKLFAVVKGAKDAGLNLNASEDILPSEERISGAHIAEYAKTLKADKAAYEKQYSAHIKSKADPETIVKVFEDVKAKISKL